MSALLLAVAILAESVKPPDSITLDGLPPIDVELRTVLRRYQDVRAARFLSWLPGEEGMLIATRFGETEQVHHVQGPLMQRAQLTFFDEPVAWAVHDPTPGSTILLLGRDQAGDEAYQLFRFDRRRREAERLTDGQGRVVVPVFAPQGGLAAFAWTRRNGVDFDLYLIDTHKSDPPRRLLEVEGQHEPIAFSADGKLLLVQHSLSNQESSLYLVEVGSGVRRALSRAERGVAYSNARFSPDCRRVLVNTDHGHEFTRLAWLKVGGDGELEFLGREARFGVESVDLSADGRTLAFTENQAGVSRLFLWDLKKSRALPAPALPEGVVTSLRFHPSGRRLAVAMEGPGFPGDVWTVELPSGKLQRWTESEIGALDSAAFLPPELLSIPSFDGQKIPALLDPPPATFARPRPVLIAFHGGPEAQARPTFLDQHRFLIQELGIALLRPNVRGSTGYGRSYQKQDDGKLREGAVRDVGALLDWIATRPELDSSRVGVFGGSYGGFMVLASLAQYPERIRSGVDIVGISHFVTFLENTSSYRRELRRAEYGDERDPDMRLFLDMISPLSTANQIRAPLLVVHGQNDPRVPAAEARQIVERVRANGGKAWFILAEDEGHNFRRKPNRDFVMLASTVFFKQYLLER